MLVIVRAVPSLPSPSALPALPDRPFTRAHAAELGVSPQQLRDLVGQRQVRRVLRNVYVRCEVPDSIEVRVAAARLVLTPGAVFVDRTAAWLHGVDVFGYRDLEVLPPLECVVLRDRSRIERPECLGGERDLLPRDVMHVFGVPVTTPLRTALDLGCALPRPDGLAALDMFLRVHEMTQADYRRELPRYRGRRGVVKLRGLVVLCDARAESARESRTRLAIHDDDLPAPVPQVWVVDGGVRIFRLDLAYPRHRVAVEYDGDWHVATDEQREADRRRRRWLAEHGWTVIVVRKGDFDARRRARWLGELRAALGLGR